MDPLRHFGDAPPVPTRCTPLRRDRRPRPTPLSADLVRLLTPVLSGPDDPLGRFVELLWHRDVAPCQALLEELLEARVAPERILLDVLTPAAQRLGDLWEDDARDFMEVTLATGRLLELLRWIEVRTPPVGVLRDRPRILLVTPSGDDHTFGALLFHSVLRYRGWSVVPVAPFWPDIETPLRDDRVGVLGVAVGSDRSVPGARTLIRKARRTTGKRRLVVVVGGALAAVRPGLAGELGADGAAADAAEALSLIGELVATERGPDVRA